MEIGGERGTKKHTPHVSNVLTLEKENRNTFDYFAFISHAK